MKLLTIMMTLAGVSFLIYSLIPISAICRKDNQPGWRLLMMLVLFFIIGYLASLVLFYTAPKFESVFLIHATILLSGSIFVVMVSQFSLRSINTIEKSITREQYNAFHDNLTGLENRQCFLKVMSEYKKNQISFTLLLIDLNNFKQVNDALGHFYGDQLLSAVAKKLNHELPEQCQLFRIGGDEFTLVWKNDTKLELEYIVNEIHELLSQPFSIQGYSLAVGASIGMSSFPKHTLNINDLLQQADIAMYVSKHRKIPFVIYSDELNDGIQEKLTIADKLQKALANKEFKLYYQPIMRADNQSPHGAEVLIRWPQSDGSFIPPDKFIPIAEQSTIINEITYRVIHQCLSDLQVLQQQGFSGCLHVNLSAKDLHNDSLINFINGLISTSNLEPDKFVFEITESTMMTDVENAKIMMTRMTEFGFTFSIDDFGTGFSSLSLLRDLPISQIKIDRSFVIDMEKNNSNHSIVNSVIHLAKNLQCSVVAEGVENQEVTSQLQSMNCDYLQGYYFSKPMPLQDFIEYLK